MQVGTPRPTTVTVLVVLAFILGILSIIIGVAGAALGALVGPYSDLAETILVTLGIVLLVLGILYISYAVGFLSGRTWSWTIGIIVAVFGIVSDLALIGLASTAPRSPDEAVNAVIGGVGFSATINTVTIILNLVTIYALTRPRVKRFFGKGPRPQT